MKRILIVNNNMHIGGVQKALLDLLNEIHKDHDITLLLFYNGGGLMKSVPEDVRVTGIGHGIVADILTPKLTTVHYHYQTDR